MANHSPIKVFFAYHANEHELQLVEHIFAKINARGLHFTWWPPRDGSSFTLEYARSAMLDCDAFIAVLIDGSSDWQLAELFCAVLKGDKERRSRTYIFAENYYPLQSYLTLLTERIQRFDRRSIDDSRQKYNLVRSEFLSMGDKFIVPHAKKETIVYPTGQGCVKYEQTMKVTDNEAATLGLLPGYYSVPSMEMAGESKKLTLQELANSKKTSEKDLYFGYGILKSPQGIQVAPRGIADSEMSNDQIRRVFRNKPFFGLFFHLALNRQLGPREEILWKYGFVRTHMFPDRNEWSDYRAVYPVECFDFEVTFLYPEYFGPEPIFLQQPQIEHTDDEETVLPVTVEVELTRDIDFVKYSWKGIRGLDLGDRVRVTWSLKDTQSST